MAEAALPAGCVSFVSAAGPKSFNRRCKALPRESLILGVVLCILQLADGFLTGLGMHRFGLHMEGNILVRAVMQELGTVSGLIIVKVVAISIVLFLVSASPRVKWLPWALRGMAALYLCAAVIPWSALLLFRA